MRKLNILSQMCTGLITKQIDSQHNVEQPFLGYRSDAGRLFPSAGTASLKLLSLKLLCERGTI